MAMDESHTPAVIDGVGIATDRVRSRLIPWLTEVVDSLENEEPLVFQLSQVTNLDGERPVRPIKYNFDRTVDECAMQIIMAAIDDMEGGNFKTDVGYALSVEGNGDARFNFTLKAVRGQRHDEVRRRDHFPDMQGLTGQLMEQNLQLTDKVIDSSGATTQLLMKLIESKDEEIRFLKRGMYERDRQVQNLMDGSLKRQMMYEEHGSKMKQSEAFADGFKQMAPPIVAQLFGPQAAAFSAALLQNGLGGGGLQLPGLSQGPTDEDLLDDLILRLEKSPQTRDKLFEVLMRGDPEALQVLGELHTRSRTRREQRARQQAEESDKRTNGASNGENGGHAP